MKRHVAALLVTALVSTIVFGTGTAVYAVEPPAPVIISDTAGLVAAIEAQKTDSAPGQTWILAPGTYDLPRFTDAQVPMTKTGGQDLWYFPIILDGLTIRGDGTGEVVLTSTTYSANGNWAAQNFIAIWANGVTIEDVTIHAKRDTNKAIEVMGKDFTLRDTEVRTNPAGPWEGYGYEKFSGSVYFNPQVSVTGVAGDVGDSRLEGVYIEGAWLSAGASTATTGSITLNDVTIDWIAGAYAPWYDPINYPYGMMSSNPLIVAENNVLFMADDTIADLAAQATSRMPVGATLDFYGTADPAAELPIGVFTALQRDGSYPADGDLYLSFESATTPGLYPYSWWFPTGYLDEGFSASFFPAVDVRTTLDTAVGDMQASADLPDDGTDIIELDCVHSGTLPGPGALTVYTDPALGGKEFALYKYDPVGETHLVDAVQTVTVDEYGYVTVSIDSGDTWYLVEVAVWPSGRIWGFSRYDTNREISQEHFESADTAIVVTGRDFADALSASGLAGIYNAPILLTDPLALSPTASAELERLGVSHVIICGGTGAVSGDVEDEILALGGISVERIGGIDRYQTSRMIADRIATDLGVTPSMVFVARGDQFADALAASPVAWAHGAPILLSKTTALSSEAAAYLAAETPERAIILGGVGALYPAVETAVLGLVSDVDRFGGLTRYDTAAMVAEWAYVERLADVRFVGVSTGVDFPDALSASAGVGARGGVMLLTQPTVVPEATNTFIAGYSADIDTLQLFGGAGAVSDPVLDELLSLAGISG